MVLLSRDAAYEVRDYVTVAPVTTHVWQIPAEVSLGPDEGLPRPSVVNLDNVNTIAKASLQRRLGVLNLAKMAAIEDAIHFALGLEG